MRIRAALVTGLLLCLSGVVHAQLHRATRLGHPDTRFAPPVTTPEELRERFRDPKLRADFAIILHQVNWPGYPEDLLRAAATAEITGIEIPVGAIMPFMSARENGRPIALQEVLWAGDAPAEAFEFSFNSRGRRYRCITPKACSNFFVEDLGPEPPRIEVQKFAPEAVDLCLPVEVRVTVRNTGGVPVSGVRIEDTLPPGFRLRDGRTLVAMDAGSLRPGEGRELKFSMFASVPGTFENVATVTTAEGATGRATSTTRVLAPVLSLECNAPRQVPIGRPIELCLTVRNTGDATEIAPTVSLQLPEEAVLDFASDGGVAAGREITWQLAALDPGESRSVCATLAPRTVTGVFTFGATANGKCAAAVTATCSSEIQGVPGFLLEVVDLADPIQVGEEVTYVITATNQGSSDVTQIRLTCLLPPAQAYVSCYGPTRADVQNRRLQFEPLEVLPAKTTVEWQVVVRALQRADARFRTELVSDQFTRPIIEMESTHQY
ncbi:MAG: DUF11 domain-containing protein [Verrucomicrobiae bacterium]|nr:DUF11 domain-containing protein [Verrucomicrobiae bacterium]